MKQDDSDDTIDRLLVKSFKQGNEQAFEEIVLRYQNKLFRWASTQLDSAEDAREVALAALTRAYRSLHKFRGDSSLSTWLFRIVCNQAHNQNHWNIRRGSSNTSSLSNLDPESMSDWELDLPDWKNTPFRSLNLREISQIIHYEITQLPEHMSQAAQLFFFDGCSYAEIALKTNCSQGTVKSRLARARAILIKKLKKYSL